MSDEKHRECVVIIGGGFAGLNAAKGLRGVDVDVVLIDRQNHHLFQPLLYQVATAGLSTADIAAPLRSVLRRSDNSRVIMGEVQVIDREARRVYFDGGALDYDYLLVAAGMENNYFGQEDEWEELAPGLKTLDDALECRRRILKAFEEAEWCEDERRLEALLTFVVVGAGPTGVEMAGAIRDIAYQVMVHEFKNIDVSKARVLLVDGDRRVLTAYDEKSSEAAEEQLEDMGVEVVLGELVEDISESGVTIDGELIPSETVIWAAGVAPSPLAVELDSERDRMGRVVVNDYLELPGDRRVKVLGDMAHYEHEGEAVPGLAPVAIQMGKFAARDIERQLKDKERKPYRYVDRGQMATIGRARAVAEVGGRSFAGVLAWFMWLFIHVLFLIGFRNRVFVIMEWFYAYLGMKRGSRIIVEPAKVKGVATEEQPLQETLIDEEQLDWTASDGVPEDRERRSVGS